MKGWSETYRTCRLGLVWPAVLLTAGLSSAALGQSMEKIDAFDGAASDTYGGANAVSGDVAIVGASMDDDVDIDSGSAYIYRFDGTNWNFDQKLEASDKGMDDRFGVSVAVSGNVAVVGADRDEDPNGSFAGSVYVFRYDVGTTTWVEEQKLDASDGAAGDRFGYSVAVDGDLIVVGAFMEDLAGDEAGAAYVFRYDGGTTTWSEEQKLSPADAAAGDVFGQSVAISGDVIAVGAYLDDDTAGNAGSAYVYRYNGGTTTWDEEQELFAGDGAAGDYFGFSVDIDGDTIVAGAYLDSDNGAGSGSAYVFLYDGSTTWSQEDKIVPSDGAANENFGRSVSVSGDVAAAGADQDDDNGSGAGSMYIYTRSGTNWSLNRKLLADDGAIGDRFGNSVAVDGDVTMSGAKWDDDNGGDSGSAYIYRVVSCPADSNGSGVVDVNDLIDMLAAWGPCAPPCPEDNDGSGTVDVSDLIALLAAWGTCP